MLHVPDFLIVFVLKSINDTDISVNYIKEQEIKTEIIIIKINKNRCIFSIKKLLALAVYNFTF